MRKRTRLRRVLSRLLLFSVQPGGQCVQLRSGLIHHPRQLGQVDLHLPQLPRHVARGGLKGAHQSLVLLLEQFHGLP